MTADTASSQHSHRRPGRHRLALAVSLLYLLWTPPARPDVDLLGHLALRSIQVDAPTSWLEGGFGVLRGGEPGSGSESGFLGEIHLGLRWEPSRHFVSHLHLLGRAGGEGLDGAEGIVEAYAEVRTFPRGRDRLRFRLGHFLLPTSFENVESLWQSPYSSTLSAVNSWVGEEMRPTGLLTEYQLAFAAGPSLVVGGSLFGGNDSAGALLAWRGWGLSDQLTVRNETLPLPPLASLRDGAVFAPQRDDGTRPFGSDLDGRLGWAGWLALSGETGAAVQLSYLDNRGDRGLYEGEYAWETELGLLGAEVPLGSRLRVLGEWMWGESGMQPGSVPGVQIDFQAWYLLASWETGRWRWSFRRDEFDTRDRDGRIEAENNDQRGSAWTTALALELARARLRLELVDVDAHRPAAVASAAGSQTGGRSLLLELRWSWN